MAADILLVEDEPAIQELVAVNLTRAGHRVIRASDAESALRMVNEVLPDLILLDWMLPGVSGVELARRLRADERTREVPIIMLTARGEEQDKVSGLEIGADDYVTKPYSSRELLARVRAVLRRHVEPDFEDSSTVTAGPVRMDIERHIVEVRGSGVTLPLKEFELLEMLIRNAGRVLTRGQLIDRVWGSDYVGDTKTLDVHVKRLRSKIEEDPAKPRLLVTVRGLGYKFDA